MIMDIRIYQINENKDHEGLMFSSLTRARTIRGRDDVDSSIYDLVYEGTRADAKNLEDIYSIFNISSDITPADFKGRSMSVSDIVEIVDDEKLRSGFYYCDRIGFERVDFNDTPIFIGEGDKRIEGVYLEPGEYAKKVSVSNDLASLQKLVEGNIEAYTAFDDGICIICNDEGKINGMRPNRGIKNSKGELADVVFGPCFLCDGRGNDFNSLSNEKMNEYLEKFRMPELLIHMPEGYQMIPYKSERMRMKDR